MQRRSLAPEIGLLESRQTPDRLRRKGSGRSVHAVHSRSLIRGFIHNCVSIKPGQAHASPETPTAIPTPAQPSGSFARTHREALPDPRLAQGRVRATA